MAQGGSVQRSTITDKGGTGVASRPSRGDSALLTANDSQEAVLAELAAIHLVLQELLFVCREGLHPRTSQDSGLL